VIFYDKNVCDSSVDSVNYKVTLGISDNFFKESWRYPAYKVLQKTTQ